MPGACGGRTEVNEENAQSNPDLIVAASPDELHPVGKLPYGIAAHLREFGITTYSELSCLTPSDLQLRLFNAGAIAHLEAELNRRNLTLRGEQQPVAPFNPTMPSPEPNPAQTPPAPNGGWHAGLTAKVPPPAPLPPVFGPEFGIPACWLAKEKGKVSATAPLIAPHHAPFNPVPSVMWPAAPEQASLRDQFAMAALNGLMANLELSGGYRALNIHEACTNVYALADGMLKARAKGQGAK